MRQRRIFTTAAAIASALALPACTGQQADPVAPPRPAPSTSTTTVTEIATVTVHAPSPTGSPAPNDTPAADVVHPEGYGALTLGMSGREARATGLLGKVDRSLPECWRIEITRGERGFIYFNPNGRGVVAIFAPSSAVTPEGIGVGSTRAEVRRAYPDVREIEGVPMFTDDYQFVAGGTVKQINLFRGADGCPG